MNEFLENLKREASANPTVAIGVAAALIGASAKLVDSLGSVKSKQAYAKVMKEAAKKAAKQ
jgi:hypothetical protein